MELSRIWYPKGAEEMNITREQYFSTIWFIRDYENMKAEAEDLLDQSPVNDGQPRGSGTSDPTAQAAERRERVLRSIKCIEDAFAIVPEEYRAVLYENIVHQRPLYQVAPKAYIADTTLQYWRVVFVAEVARNRERNEWRSY